MKELERTLKSLANRRRLAIIKHLKRNTEASVGEIATAIHLSLRSTSKHLSVLSSRDIVDKEQRGLSIYYRLANSQVPSARAIISLI